MRIYADTNVLRHLGRAFQRESLPQNLELELLLCPFSIMELLSQLGTEGAQEAFDAIQAFPRLHNPRATGILPWSNDFFRAAIFELPMNEDTITEPLNRAVNGVLNSNSPQEFREAGNEMRENLRRAKAESAANFRAMIEGARRFGDLDVGEHRKIFAESIARRSGVAEEGLAIDHIVSRLDAHFRFERKKIEIAIRDEKYNIEKHANDLLDAELLIYLAEPSLTFLTCDQGFRRAQDSPQTKRIHIVHANDLDTTEQAIRTLRRMVQGSPRAEN